jgi:hypothetical protein
MSVHFLVGASLIYKNTCVSTAKARVFNYILHSIIFSFFLLLFGKDAILEKRFTCNIKCYSCNVVCSSDNSISSI